jgi:hypothetical protein
MLLAYSNFISPTVSAKIDDGTKPRMQRMNTEFRRFKSIIKTVADAFTNPSLTSLFKNHLKDMLTENIWLAVYIGFDAVEFDQRHVNKKSFPNPNIGLVNVPATFVDSRGRIAIWYLPDITPQKIHVNILIYSIRSTRVLTCNTKDDAMEATTHLSKILDNTRKYPMAGKNVSWRVRAKNFASNSPTRKHASGAETFSAGWYAQGHNVSSVSLCTRFAIFIQGNMICSATD